jgi:hypothetical protein
MKQTKKKPRRQRPANALSHTTLRTLSTILSKPLLVSTLILRPLSRLTAPLLVPPLSSFQSIRGRSQDQSVQPNLRDPLGDICL